MNIQHLTKVASSTFVHNAPMILTGLTVAGVVGTAMFAAEAAPRARDIVDHHIECLERDNVGRWKAGEEAVDIKITTWDRVRLTWKLYLPTLLAGTATIACAIGAQSLSGQRNAALMSAYSLAQATAREYQMKVLETFGEKKELAVRDGIAVDKVEKNPPTDSQVIITGRGETLILDAYSGRYFKSDIQTIKEIQNDLNRTIINDSWVSLSEFYSRLGLMPTTASDDIGWTTDAFIDLTFSSTLDGDTPCVVITHRAQPQFGAWYGH